MIKEYAGNFHNLSALKCINICNVGKVLTTTRDNLSEGFFIERDMERESFKKEETFSFDFYNKEKAYIKDSNKAEENYYEYENKHFKMDLMNYTKYKKFISITFNASFEETILYENYYLIMEDYFNIFKCYDYSSLYYFKGSQDGKKLLLTGHQNDEPYYIYHLIIGLEEEEYKRILNQKNDETKEWLLNEYKNLKGEEE